MAAQPLHYVNLSTNGTFTASGALRSHPSSVDAIFKHLRETRQRHLVLYFHGGRTSESDGKQTADVLEPVVSATGAHPVFFLWESAEMEVLPDNLRRIGQDPLFDKLLQYVEQVVLGKLKGRGAGRTVGGLELASSAEVEAMRQLEAQGGSAVPEAALGAGTVTPLSNVDAQQLATDLEGDPRFVALANQLLFQANVTTTGRGPVPRPPADAVPSLVSAEVLESIRQQAGPEGRGLPDLAFLIGPAVQIAGRCVGRVITGTHHGVHCTVVEEIARQLYADKIGAFIWAAMKQRASAAFHPNAGLAGDNLHGGTYFLERLRDYLASSDNPPLEVSLVGHSAGAVYICHLLDKAYRVLPQTFTFKHVVLLAPAADFTLFSRAIVERPQGITSFRVYNLRDDLECRDAMVPYLYPRSLLYCVSGLLEGDDETPLVGMERFYSGAYPYDGEDVLAGREYVKALGRDREVWSIAADAGAGLNCDAEHHGGFPLASAMKTSLAELLGA